jgi:hypothetical protein
MIPMKVAERLAAGLAAIATFVIVGVVPVLPGPGGNSHCPDPTAVEYCGTA